MKAATVPWSVKGIDPEFRETAKEAARRSGMTLGEWLKTAINEQAEAADVAPVARTAGLAQATSFERATSKLEDIAAQLAKLAQRDAPATGYAVYQPDTRQQDNEQVTRILNRLESNERQSVEAFTAINDRMATMGRQFAQAAKAATSFKPEEHASFQALEKAVRNIVEHLESSEKRTRENFRTMQDRLADISSRAAAAPNEQVLKQLPAFSSLEQKLNDLSRRIEVTERAPDPSVPELLRKELTDLAGRIDVVRETAESLATRAQTQAVLTSQQELRAIEARMQSVLKEAQQAFSHGSATDGELQRIRADVEALNKRIDSTRQGTASDRDVHALRVAVEQLSSRVAQGPDLRPLQDMDRRIVELAQRINDTPQQEFPQADELHNRITELDQRLTHVLADTRSEETGAELARQIAAVAERMDKAEQQLTHLDTIERAINQLYDGLEQTRAMGSQLAEEAAMKAAQQFAAQLPPAGPVPDIQALEHGLQAVRDAAEQSDHRNQETLLALHETLEHIVGKLSELETATLGQRIAVAAGVVEPAAMAAPAQSFAAPAATTVASPAADTADNDLFETPEAEDVVQSPRSAATPPAYSSDTIPQEGYEALAPEIELTAQPRAQTEVAAEPRLPDFETRIEDPAADAPKAAADDFIAAARRAAQAASQNRSVFSGSKQRRGKSDGKAGASDSIIGKLAARFKRGGTSEARTAAEEIRARTKSAAAIAPAPGQDKSRKKLLYIGLLILAAAAAITASRFGGTVTSAIPGKVSELISPWIGTDPAPAEPAKTVATVPAAAIPAPALPATAKAQPPVADDILTGSVSPADQLTGIVAPKTVAAESLPPTAIGPGKLRIAAATGNAQAQFIVASRFMDGERVERDFTQAAQWYSKAAAAGLAPAQYRIATLYERGKGVNKDVKQALTWYEKAAELGNVRSMHNTAVIYAGTDAGKADYAKAYKWFALAASHGLKDSQFNLAILLERGLGVKADPAEAMFWYLAAARQNDTDAQKRADTIAASLPPEQAAQIKLKIKSWQPDQAPDIANTVQVNDADWQDQAG